jgi:hypothetical protein
MMQTYHCDLATNNLSTQLLTRVGIPVKSIIPGAWKILFHDPISGHIRLTAFCHANYQYIDKDCYYQPEEPDNGNPKKRKSNYVYRPPIKKGAPSKLLLALVKQTS